MSGYNGYGLAHHRSPMTGAHHLTRGSEAWPAPSTGLDMAGVKTWLEEPISAGSSIKKKHVAIGAGVLALVGVAYYGHNHRWF
jgi:hypothetical protein